jgi:nucleoside-diphosphate kinase
LASAAKKEYELEERTFVMIKPDATARHLVGRIVARFEDAGLLIERLEQGVVTPEQAKANYAEHEGKPFYEGLIAYITSGPVVKMVLRGPDAVVVCRKLMGATNPREAAPGTIRGDFGLELDANVVHGSDSPASAEREIGIFF